MKCTKLNIPDDDFAVLGDGALNCGAFIVVAASASATSIKRKLRTWRIISRARTRTRALT